jgi:hypothetical protein
MNPLIILGNGQSLKNIDLKTLEFCDTFGMNGSFIKFEEIGFYPTYFAALPMGPFKWTWNSIQEFIRENYTKVSKFFFYDQNEKDINLPFNNIEYLKAQPPNFIDFDTKKYSLPLNVEIEIALSKIAPKDIDNFGKFLYTLKKDVLLKLNYNGLIKNFYDEALYPHDYVTLPRYKTSWIPPKSFKAFTFSGGNSSVIACLLGYLMGYEKIILLGVDCNWKLNNKIVDTDQSYWFNSYFGDKTYDVRDFCEKCTEESLQKMHLESWINLNEMIEVNNIKLEIVNCSKGSALTLFRQSVLEKEI